MIMMKFKDKEEGSITLEAALVMPTFVFLLFMIKFALTNIALNRVAAETAKQIATQVHLSIEQPKSLVKT